jgi:hypothetical protein
MNTNQQAPLALDDPRFRLVDGRTRPEFILVGGMKCGSPSFARAQNIRPVDRAYSHYIMSKRAGLENACSFEDIVRREMDEVPELLAMHERM